MNELTLADELRPIPEKWLWGGVLVIVLVIGGGMTPWDALASVLLEGGVGDEGAALLGFVAGYTFPLTAGLTILAYLGLVGGYRGVDRSVAVLVAAGILFTTTLVAGWLGIGQLPTDAVPLPTTGPPQVRPLAWLLSVYVNSYGWSLALSSAAISVGLAIQLERWTRSNGSA